MSHVTLLRANLMHLFRENWKVLLMSLKPDLHLYWMKSLVYAPKLNNTDENESPCMKKKKHKKSRLVA